VEEFGQGLSRLFLPKLPPRQRSKGFQKSIPKTKNKKANNAPSQQQLRVSNKPMDFVQCMGKKNKQFYRPNKKSQSTSRYFLIFFVDWLKKFWKNFLHKKKYAKMIPVYF
jgi:hypothetical protein